MFVNMKIVVAMNLQPLLVSAMIYQTFYHGSGEFLSVDSLISVTVWHIK